MDWSSVAFDWNRVRAFLVTAEEGSLSAAARALGLSQPTLGRQVAALESELGVTLFARTGRGYALTHDGLDLLEHVRSMGEAARRVALVAGGRADAVEGNIAITASELYAASLLPPIVRRLRSGAPGIEIEIVASNDTMDLRRREADIALRNTPPTQPDLIARKLGQDRAHLYAAPALLERLGHPTTPDALAQRAELIGFDHSPRLCDGLNALGYCFTVRNFPIVTASHLVQWEMMKRGVAIGVVPEAMGDAEPAVTRVLPDFPAITFDAWLITHEELTTSRRVRMVFDTMVKMLTPRFHPA